MGDDSEGAPTVAEELSLLLAPGLLFEVLATGVAFSASTLRGFPIDNLCVVFGGTVDLPRATIHCRDGPLASAL